MFGYVKSDIPNMYIKDDVLYKAMYCGLCKGIGKCCGQKARFLLSYDLTFLSVFLHNLCDKDVVIKKQHCIIHPITKKPIANVDDLTIQIGALNVILAYHKLNDDVLDSGKGKVRRSFFKSSYKKAKKKFPRLDEIVDKWYSKLLEYEKQNVESIDMASDPFGQMIAEVVQDISGEHFDQNVYNLSYHLGKWIYLIDALDDFEKDIKKNNFNVFHNAYKDFVTKKELYANHSSEIIQILSDCLSTIIESSKNIKYKFNHDLIDNILILGLKEQTKLVLENNKCKNTTNS